jgi:Protein of unknown function (DUF2874).
MKTKLMMLTLAAAGFILVGCDKDDDGIRVEPELENAFLSQYPDATRVEWEQKAGYYVAEFHRNNAEAEAWYSAQAIWYMTETDVLYADLPQAIKTALAASEYADWHIDDIDMLECPDMETVYIIEVEQGKTEYDLYYSPDGVFIKATPDGGDSGHLPPTIQSSIKEYIAQKYPQARIADIDTEHNQIEVDIIDGQTARELTFTLAGKWVSTKTEVRERDLPQVVLIALISSEYASWKIDDIDHYDTPTGEYYQFELESGNQEIYLKIDLNGNIV